MPEKIYHNPRIEVRVSDFVINDTKIHQMVWNYKISMTQSHDGFLTTILECLIIPYASVEVSADSDGWGDELKTGPFISRAYDYMISNKTLVEFTENPLDPNFGKILARTGQSVQDKGLTPQQEWDWVLNEFTGTYMGEGDLMIYVRDNIPQLLGDMIRNYIKEADAAGKFN